MRIDKFLKISRLIKRRTIAKEACDQGRILINDKPAKPGSEVEVDDIITISYSGSELKAKIKKITEHATKDSASELYEVIE